MDLLREHSEIDRHTRWSDFKKKIDSDHRYKMVDSSSLREDYFREFIRMLKDERRHKEKEKSKREKVDKDQESDPVRIYLILILILIYTEIFNFVINII